ncbi:hypothetical protein SAMN05444338_101389 [Flavobacterium degerlachei]|uniref:Uncharacterized protein n=1 Tax=Flavobacterium degerlachei TaxID=229203 RepID=A0A1H2RCK5_9FLAO|nr:hypothetical protein SAMN05444338_101389 [Flavobacterium degerlachei]
MTRENILAYLVLIFIYLLKSISDPELVLPKLSLLSFFKK